MKKVFFSLLAALLLVSLVACTTKEKENDGWNKDYKVAMVTDYGDITDQSFNQATYEGAKAWCEENKVHFTYKNLLVTLTQIELLLQKKQLMKVIM